MSRIASIPTPSVFSSRTPQRQPSLISLNQKPDQVLFGKGKKDKHEKHDHHHDHDHADDKKHNWFRRQYDTVKGWFKPKKADKTTQNCSDDHCSKPHDHDHAKQDHAHDHKGNWLERQLHSIKHWFKNVYEHIKEDWINLHDWLKKKFPNAMKRSLPVKA